MSRTIQVNSLTQALAEMNVDASFTTQLEQLVLKHEQAYKIQSGGDLKLPFGKHKGKTMYEIAQEDPGYITYLVKADYIKEKFDDIYNAALAFK